MVLIANRAYDTLFLDRDGVINRMRSGDYVKCWAEFEFLPGVLQALARCNTLFERIYIVTNQRGVGRGVMTREDLNDIHDRMLRSIVNHGGRIDKIYSCTATSADDPCRKPNTGMAQQARMDFPQIDFSKALMVGDSQSDELFAQRVGMDCVLIGRDYSSLEALVNDSRII